MSPTALFSIRGAGRDEFPIKSGHYPLYNGPALVTRIPEPGLGAPYVEHNEDVPDFQLVHFVLR
jgi:hypothetical protein